MKLKGLKTLAVVMASLLPATIFANEEIDKKYIRLWQSATPEVFERFKSGLQEYYKDWVLGFADTLEMIQKDDEFSMYANKLRRDYAYAHGDSTEFLKWYEPILEQTAKYENWGLYYTEKANTVTFYLNMNDSHKAFLLTKKMIAEAQKNGHTVGLYYGYFSLGALYYAFKDFKRSTAMFNNCLNYYNDANGNDMKSLAYIYYLICVDYVNLYDFKTAMTYADKSEQLDETNYDLNYYKALCHFETRDDKRFREDMDRFMANVDNGEEDTEQAEAELKIMALSIDGKHEQALSLCEDLKSKEKIWRCKARVYRRMENWKEAYATMEHLATLKDSLNFHNANFQMQNLIEDLEEMNEEKIQNEEAARQRQTITVTGFIAVMMILILATIIIHLRKSRKVKERELNRAIEHANELTIHKQELEQANKELAEAREKAERSNQVKTQFLQNMNHEIRTPINAIAGFAQLLCLPEEVVSKEERDEYISYINNNTHILLMLIDDLLDIADVENGNFKITTEAADCNEICRHAIKSIEYRKPDKVGLTFTTDMNDGTMVTTDPRRVQQVLINFLSNACKHTKEGEINLNCTDKLHPGFITFAVTDTGEGVPAEKADQIFERFTKLNAFVQGTGLGLNICKTVAEKMNARLYLDKSYRTGARFVFEIRKN